nr:integrase, catalytic region, zinc finger, CCHC-type, peptidase aspartic, catalytic [Tanacetum cinerariifolium]
KTPYELLRDRKPELKYLYVCGALCYPTNDFEDLRKLQPKADIRIFVSYSPTIQKGFVVSFDEYFKLPSVVSITISAATIPLPDTIGASSFTTIDQDATYPSTSPNNETTTSPINSTNVKEPNNEEESMFDSDTFTNLFAPPETSLAESSSRIVNTSNMHTFQQPQINTRRWTKDLLLVTIISNPSKLVSIRRQLTTDALWTKHIAVRYHLIKEQVENEIVKLYFVKIAYQLADIFTKALARECIEFLVKRLGMQSITPEELKYLAESKEDEE